MIVELLQVGTDAIQELINAQLAATANTTTVRSEKYIKDKSVSLNFLQIVKDSIKTKTYKKITDEVRENEMTKRHNNMTDKKHHATTRRIGGELLRQLGDILDGTHSTPLVPVNKELVGWGMIPGRANKMWQQVTVKEKQKTQKEMREEIKKWVGEIRAAGGYVQFKLSENWSVESERNWAYNSRHPTKLKKVIELLTCHKAGDYNEAYKAIELEVMNARKGVVNGVEPPQAAAPQSKKRTSNKQKLELKKYTNKRKMSDLKVNEKFMSAYSNEYPEFAELIFEIVATNRLVENEVWYIELDKPGDIYVVEKDKDLYCFTK